MNDYVMNVAIKFRQKKVHKDVFLYKM